MTLMKSDHSVTMNHMQSVPPIYHMVKIQEEAGVASLRASW